MSQALVKAQVEPAQGGDLFGALVFAPSPAAMGSAPPLGQAALTGFVFGGVGKLCLLLVHRCLVVVNHGSHFLIIKGVMPEPIPAQGIRVTESGLPAL